MSNLVSEVWFFRVSKAVLSLVPKDGSAVSESVIYSHIYTTEKPQAAKLLRYVLASLTRQRTGVLDSFLSIGRRYYRRRKPESLS
jgi:prophage antirepressor-like protein